MAIAAASGAAVHGVAITPDAIPRISGLVGESLLIGSFSIF